ncbi:MAG: DUF3606 domain-containing protein [Mucilaginibacter sp.]
MNGKLKMKEPDTRSIDIDDSYALEFWTRELNVSPTKLKAIVMIAGTTAADVKRELKNKG